MSFVGDLIGSITGTKQASQAAQDASSTQAQMAQQGIAEQRRQFDMLVQLMSPFVTAGTGALEQQQALLGLQGPEEQAQSIAGLASSPQMQSLIQQGENALLQNASATGGLRGGNVQAALAQFRPEMLSQLINQQYANLGGLTSLGQAAAAGQATGGMQSANAISNLLNQQGAAIAGGQLARGAQAGNTFGSVANLAGGFFGAGGIPGITKAFGF